MKYSIEEAKKIFGVSPEATKEDIEKKYDIALRKYNQQKSQGVLTEDYQKNFGDITEAYRIIMGYEVDVPIVQRKDTSYDRMLKKQGLDRGKVNNFFHYHKIHIIVAILVIIAVIYTANSMFTRVTPDVTIGLIGETNMDSYTAFKSKITQNIPEAKEIAIDSAFLSKTIKNEQDFANLQKAIILLSTSDVDVLVVNKYAYDLYVRNGPFMDLSEYAAKLGLDTSGSKDLKRRVVAQWEEVTDPNAERKAKTYKDSEPKQYGLDITKSGFFKGIEDIIGPERILVVRNQTKNPDLDLKIIQLLTK